jgi:hypothetical protein
MKQGKTLNQLAAELTRIQETKRDFAVPVTQLSMNTEGALTFGNDKTFGLNSWSAGQVSAYTEIPKAYFDRLQTENKALLADNVNHAFSKSTKDTRLVRTVDGHVRGFLSSKYRMLDGHDLLETILPTLMDNNFEVQSSEVTERRLYLKTASPKIEGEVSKGDVVQYGVMISTSDVGAGSLKVEPYLTRLVCMNGMIMETSFKKAHLGGSKLEQEVQELLSSSTKRLNDAAFFATVRDYLTATMRPEIFEREVNKMREAAGQQIKNFDLDKVIELSMKEVGVSGETVKQGILHALASGNEGAGLTKWGLANSFTRAAQMDSLDYDTATELERAGGLILNLNKTQWARVAEVA